MLRRQGIRALALLGVLCVGISGCKQETTSNGSSSPGGTGGVQSATGTGSGGGTGGAKFKVVYIPKNSGNPYFDSLITGLKKSGTELGFEVDSVAPSSPDATSQIPIIKQQVQQGVNAIIISPNSPDALKSALKEAMAKGIKVVTVDSDMTGNEEARDAAVLPTDPATTGKSLIELLSSLIDNKGEFAILSATTDAPNQNVWIGFMKETLKDPKYKDMKLVEIAYGDDKDQKSATETQGLLTKYPNLRAILAPTSVGIAAAAQVVETKGVSKQVQVTGLGTPNLMRRFVKDGIVQKLALWSPADAGYLAGYVADGLMKGTLKPAAGVTFKAGTLGDHKFGDKNVVITGPPVVFDKSNIDQYQF